MMYEDLIKENQLDEIERWKNLTRVHAREYTNIYMMVENGEYILVIPGDNNDWIYLHSNGLLRVIRDCLNEVNLGESEKKEPEEVIDRGIRIPKSK